MADVLIIDDDRVLCELLAAAVRKQGCSAVATHTLSAGVKAVGAGNFSVVYLDVLLPDGNGLDMIQKIHSAPSSPEVIVMTARGDTQGAALAIKNGAWDYLEKPSSINTMLVPLVHALQYREARLMASPLASFRREGIVGKSAAITRCLERAAQAAASDSNVLITGETGTGKEVFAWTIHNNSRRADKNFVVVDCASLSETLVEGILFGYRKGAFTGADKSRDGLIKQADGGTLFLDEVGEMPLSVQKAFLRVLQERRFRPLGARQEDRSDFRVIAATNRDLEEMVRKGQFRSDLFFRLKALTIELPALRDHCEDIPELVHYHVGRIASRYGCIPPAASPEFFSFLRSYDWPGNIRELVNALELVMATSAGATTIFPHDLPAQIRLKAVSASLAGSSLKRVQPSPPDDGKLPPLHNLREETLANVERNYLLDLIALYGDDIKRCCAVSGLSRSRLYELLKKYDLPAGRTLRALPGFPDGFRLGRTASSCAGL